MMSANRIVIILLLLWFINAFLLGFSGKISELTPPLPQIIIFVLVIILLLIFNIVQTLKNWILSINIKYLIGIHLSRFIGIYFLILYSRDLLPYDFAVKGGMGDIFIAVTALLLIIFISRENTIRDKLYLVWNTLGFIDILFVVLTAARIGMKNPVEISELFKLPLSLLPTFLVPIIIVTHIMIFIRLFRSTSY
jgi:hypothetical protein